MAGSTVIVATFLARPIEAPPRDAGPRRVRRRSTLATLLAAPLLLGLAGCRIDIGRVRAGNPIDEADYESLEVGRTTKEQAVTELGAPEKVEWKSGPEEDHLWYLHEDGIRTALRFLFPPFRSWFGYQHTFLRLSEDSEEVNALHLIFDKEGVLRQKDLRLSAAYREEEPPTKPGWVFQVLPQAEYSVLLLGDGGVRNYDTLFQNGYRLGLQVGFQPAPIVTLLAGGSYQSYRGDSFDTQDAAIEVDDLRLYQAEIGVRLEIPLELFSHIGSPEEIQKILLENDPSRARGLRLYIVGTTGVTFNDDVPVAVDGAADGTLYDSGVELSGGAGTGLEYEWSWGSLFAGINYAATGAFEEGDSSVDGDGDAMEVLFVTGGFSVKF